MRGVQHFPWHSRHAPTLSSSNLIIQKQYVTRLYTSYFPGRLFPSQLVIPAQRLPSNANWSRTRTPADLKKQIHNTTDTAPTEVSWEDDSSDMNRKLNSSNNFMDSRMPRTHKSATECRPYFPLGEVAKIELQADYLTEGGLHQEALEHYGVVAKAYELAYPENHSKQVGIFIKLGGALRRTGRLKSSKSILTRALHMTEKSQAAHLELIVEGLLELGLTEETLNEDTAGATLEEAVQVVEQFHNFGASHKMLRLLPRLGRRLNLNFEEKFLYYSPFDWDRTYALADQCLHRATEFYKKKKNREGVIRVLQTRVELVGKKFFNMRDFAGRIHTMRGHWMRRARVLTDGPTPDELLRFSPTIHQVYRDFKYELNAPLGREEEVAAGTNRVVLDSGNPYRRNGAHSREMMRDADYNFKNYIRRNEFGQ